MGVVGIGAREAQEAKAVAGDAGVQARPPCLLSFSSVTDFDHVGVASFVRVAGSTGATAVVTVGR